MPVNNSIQALFLGVLQGITEFLPISSSAHLILLPWLMGWEAMGLTFDVVVHGGTLLALVIYFRKDWKELGEQFLRFLKRPSVPPPIGAPGRARGGHAAGHSGWSFVSRRHRGSPADPWSYGAHSFPVRSFPGVGGLSGIPIARPGEYPSSGWPDSRPGPGSGTDPRDQSLWCDHHRDSDTGAEQGRRCPIFLFDGDAGDRLGHNFSSLSIVVVSEQ